MELLTEYADADFLAQLGALSPAVGVGVILAVIFAVLGWLFGLVIRLGKVEA